MSLETNGFIVESRVSGRTLYHVSLPSLIIISDKNESRNTFNEFLKEFVFVNRANTPFQIELELKSGCSPVRLSRTKPKNFSWDGTSQSFAALTKGIA